MGEIVGRGAGFLFAGIVGLSFLPSGASAQNAQTDPPARVGRLAYIEGTVSFHDAQQDTWSPASANAPLTTGDGLWTEPTGHDEIAIAGTRVRMDGDTQLDMLAIDDSQVRLQLDQGRLDIKAFNFDNSQPYQILTPRGTVTLEQQGDYYIHAGSTDDPTLLGVRAGAAQIQTPDGQVLAVRAGEVGEVTGTGATLQLVTVRSAPPVVPAYWAQRDQQITWAQPQYLSADVTGYEDMAAYGAWTADPQYGQVWYPNAAPTGWAPYTTGSWSYVAPWGWTWVDAQPWGFAPYHYGRWANRDGRWLWLPPQRSDPAIYAPALVAFMGGAELGIAIGAASSGPVGWFPLGPNEPYVPPYTTDRAYYERLNQNAGVQAAILNDRWQRAQGHATPAANQPNETFANRRFATVVPANAFVSSRPVQGAEIKVSADKLASAPVAAVAAPPAPGRPIASTQPGPANAAGRGPAAQTPPAGMETLGRPAAAAHATAPGPKIASLRANEPNAAHPALPPLAPRTGSAPPKLEGERTPAAQHPGALPPVPQANRAEPPRPGAQPGEPPRPAQPQATQRPTEVTPQVAHPESARPVQPPAAQRPAEVTPQAQHPESPRPVQPPAAQHPAEVTPQVAHSAPARPAERAPTAPPPLVHPSAVPPRPETPHPAAEVPRPAAPPPHPAAEAPRPIAEAPPHPAAPAPAAHPAPPPPHPAAPPPKEEEKK